MITANALPIFLSRTEQQLLEYFKKRRATSEKTAIVVDLNEIKSQLDYSEMVFLPLERYKFIIKTSEDKYYVSEDIYYRNLKLVKTIIVLLSLILFLGVLTSYLF